MTNLELLNYALIGIVQSADIIQQYESPSDKRTEMLKSLKSDRMQIENQIDALTTDKEKVVNIL